MYIIIYKHTQLHHGPTSCFPVLSKGSSLLFLLTILIMNDYFGQKLNFLQVFISRKMCVINNLSQQLLNREPNTNITVVNNLKISIFNII